MTSHTSYNKYNKIIKFFAGYIIGFGLILYSVPALSVGQYSLEAEHVEYDTKKNVMTAKGNVELFRKDYLLKADKVVYDKIHNKANAYGNVVLIKPNGEEIYASLLELDDNLKEILAFELKARMNDNNVFTARNAHGYQDRMIFDKASYSPCNICKDNQTQWQVRSSKIEYIKKKDTIFVNNFFDIYGVTSFYLPYFKVASFDAEPRSGFLMPNYYKYKAIYGHGVSIPYYLRMNDSNDFLYYPVVTTKKNILHFGTYRFMLQKGHTNDISFDYVRAKQRTIPSSPRDRYYITSKINHEFSPSLLLHSDIEVVSDKSYLKNYRDKMANYLSSIVHLNYLAPDSQSSVAGHHFQELRIAEATKKTDLTVTPSSMAVTPSDITVAPRLKYDKTVIIKNNRVNVRSEALNIAKRNSGNTSKMNLEFDWNNNYAIGNNKLETYKVVYLDIYKFSNLKPIKTSSLEKNYIFARAVPELSTAWKYPVMFVNNVHSTYVEPVIKLIASPTNVHNDNIFNEDSQEIELTDGNLFNNNRYSGSDRLEEGFRASYGLIGSGQVLGYEYPKYDFVFGQGYRAKKTGDYSINSGLKENKFSDYVGRISLKTSYIMDLHYLFQIDQEDYKFRKNEINSAFKFDINRNHLDKFVLDAKLSGYNYKVNRSGIDKSISLIGKLYFLKEWYISAGLTENIYKKANKPIQTNFAIGYNGQCTNIILSATNNGTSDTTRGIKKGGPSFSFEIHLKNIN